MRYLAFLLIGCLLALPAAAQTYPNPIFNNVTILGTLNGGTLNIVPYQLNPLGHQTISAATLATAQSLTVPTGAILVDIFIEGGPGADNACVRYLDDGTSPTATVGAPLGSGAVLRAYSTTLGGSLASVKFIEASNAACFMTVNFYK